MNKFRSKIQGFTLLELLVGLTLTTIIVGMSYFAYNYVFSGFAQYDKIGNEINDHYSMKRNIDNIFARSEELFLEPNGVSCMNHGIQVQKVLCFPDAVLFEEPGANSDTISLKVIDKKWYWSKDSMLKIGSPVQKLKIVIEFAGKPRELIFEKKYDAQTMIRLDSIYKSLGE